MHTTHTVLTLIALAFTVFTATVSLTGWPAAVSRQALATLDRVGVARSWQRFPIGTVKTLLALGLLGGLLGVPAVGTAAVVGLIAFWSCATFAHLRVADYDHHLPLTSSWLAISVAILVLDLAMW